MSAPGMSRDALECGFVIVWRCSRPRTRWRLQLAERCSGAGLATIYCVPVPAPVPAPVRVPVRVPVPDPPAPVTVRASPGFGGRGHEDRHVAGGAVRVEVAPAEPGFGDCVTWFAHSSAGPGPCAAPCPHLPLCFRDGLPESATSVSRETLSGFAVLREQFLTAMGRSDDHRTLTPPTTRAERHCAAQHSTVQRSTARQRRLAVVPPGTALHPATTRSPSSTAPSTSLVSAWPGRACRSRSSESAWGEDAELVAL